MSYIKYTQMSLLSPFAAMKYVQNNAKINVSKLFIQLYMAPFAIQQNISKCEDITLNYSCIKLTTEYNILLKSFYSPVYSSVV